MEGKHLYESLLNGTIGLMDIALMNDALDIAAYNDRRRAEMFEQEQRGRERRW